MEEDIIDILLDEENKDPIVLTDDKGRKLAFEQIAVIPYDQKLYCVLKPIDHIDGVADDEALVFYVDEGENEDDTPVLRIENDELKAIDIFMEYYNLLEAETKWEKQKEKEYVKCNGRDVHIGVLFNQGSSRQIPDQ